MLLGRVSLDTKLELCFSCKGASVDEADVEFAGQGGFDGRDMCVSVVLLLVISTIDLDFVRILYIRPSEGVLL